MSDELKLWLLKQNNYVLGPFTKEEIVEKLQKHHISLSDEVSLPLRFWRPIYSWDDFQFLQDPSYFESFEETSARTDTDTNIPTDVASQSDDLTDVIPPENWENTLKVGGNTQAERSKDSSDSVKSFDMLGSSEAQKEAKQSLRWLWTLVILVGLFTVTFLFYNQQIQKPAQKEALQKNYKEEGLKQWEQGEYEKAFQSFKKAYELTPGDSSFWLPLAMLWLEQDQSSPAGKLFRVLLENTSLKEEKAWIYNGLGLLRVKKKDYIAAETAFQKALKNNPKSLPAILNRGVIKIYERKYKKAIEFLRGAQSRGEDGPLVFFLMGFSYFQWGLQTGSLDHFNQSLMIFKEILSLKTEYYQEALLLSAFIYSTTDQAPKALVTLEKFIDADPETKSQYRRSLFVDEYLTDWAFLFSYCEKLFQKFSESSVSKIFQVECLLKSGNRQKAKVLLERALASEPRNPALHGLSFYVLKKSGLDPEASVALGSAIEYNQDKTLQRPFLFQARFCEKSKDWDCAMRYWFEIYDRDRNSVPALAGLSRVYYEKRNLVKAREFFDEAFRRASNYKPLLKLQEELHSQP